MRIGVLKAACICAAFALTLSLTATGQAKVLSGDWKVLSKEEAAAGWINLFDGQTMYGWTLSGDGQWKVDGGNIVCANGTNGALTTTSEFADFKFEAKVRVSEEGIGGIAVRSACDGHPSETGSPLLVIHEPKGGGADWHTVEIEANGGNLTAKVDGKEEAINGTRGRGHIAFFYYGHGDQGPWERRIKLEISEAKLMPLNLKSLFNGKDLSGWSVIPGHKSEFKVVDGALNITNGNGQIETTELFKDFALQLDVFSNGDHLNSGVFYRGPVGVFWKGYESQVRNQWEGDDRTKPVDFGTGGNYGNQESRMVVSSDREWFKKTIIVTGNHAAVWVNGFQTSDFADNRPVQPENDGKNGYVPGPGTIHLQGHDPTTNLSFKNINAAEYPKN